MRPLHDGKAALDRRADGREDDVETVPFGADLRARMVADRPTDERPVAQEQIRRRHRTTGLDEAGVATQIGEQEPARDRAAGALVGGGVTRGVRVFPRAVHGRILRAGSSPDKALFRAGQLPLEVQDVIASLVLITDGSGQSETQARSQ